MMDAKKALVGKQRRYRSRSRLAAREGHPEGCQESRPRRRGRPDRRCIDRQVRRARRGELGNGFRRPQRRLPESRARDRERCAQEQWRRHEGRSCTVARGDGTVNEMLQGLVATIGENMTLRRAASAVGLRRRRCDLRPQLGRRRPRQDRRAGRARIAGRQVAPDGPRPQGRDARRVDEAARRDDGGTRSGCGREGTSDPDAQAAEFGKPANVIEKMVEGRIRKFYQESVLVEQAFVMDPDVTVGKFIENAGKNMGAPVNLKGFAEIRGRRRHREGRHRLCGGSCGLHQA